MAFKDDGARGPGVRGKGFVETQTGADQAIVGEVAQLRPGDLDLAPAGDQAQALVAAPAF